MDTRGIHHLGLAVADLEQTTRFFTDCLGWSIVREIPGYPAKFVSNGEAFFTLWQVEAGSSPFDRRTQVGLHHVAIRVADEPGLEDVFRRAADFPGGGVDFPPEPLRGGPARHCMIFEPGGIRMEFIRSP